MRNSLIKVLVSLLCCLSLCSCEKDMVVRKNTPMFHINDIVYCRGRNRPGLFSGTYPVFKTSTYKDKLYLNASISEVKNHKEVGKLFSIRLSFPEDSLYEGSIIRENADIDISKFFSENMVSRAKHEEEIREDRLFYYQEVDSLKVSILATEGIQDGDRIELKFSFVLREYLLIKSKDQEEEDTMIFLNRYVCPDGILKEVFGYTY